jgi:hypothetical protein
LQLGRHLGDLVEEQRAPPSSSWPRTRRSAPVKAPRSCPKMSDSMSAPGKAEQLTAMKG